MATRARASAKPAVPSEKADIACCLSFVNTVSGRQTEKPNETMESFEALVGWAREAGLLEPADAGRLSARAKRRQDQAEGVLTRARELRELLHETFSATSAGRAPSPATLEGLSTHLARWYLHGRLVPGPDSLQWIYSGQNDLDRVLWEVARAASRLLTSSQLPRVRPCAASTCGWWFFDDTKNASRRWCDMKICGNREKLRRFRETRRARR